jgi:DNA-binding response OmpR family regulator
MASFGEQSPGKGLWLLDVGPPGGMNGRQLADAARAFQPGLKVLVVTGVGNRNLGPGMNLVVKPFGMSEFAGQLRELIKA